MDYYNVFLHDFFLWIFFFIFFQNGLCRFCFVVFFKKNIVNCYNVSPHSFCFAIVFHHMFCFQNYFCQFVFNIKLVKNSALTFSTCFFHFFLLFSTKIVFFSLFSCVFFQNYFCWFYFFNMELVENLAL